MQLSKSHLFWFLKFVILLGLTYLLYYFVSIDSLLKSFSEFNLVTVITVSVMYFIGIYLSVIRWQVFLKNKGFHLSSKLLYKSYIVGSFVNNFLPSTVGGDVSKLLYVKEIKDKKGDFGSTIIAERLTGIILTVVWGFLASLILDIPSAGTEYYRFGQVALFGSVLGIILLFVALYKGYHIKILSLLPEKIRNKVTQIVHVLTEYQLNRGELMRLLFVSSLFFFTSVVSIHMYLYTLGYSVTTAAIVFVVSVVTIVSLVPISLNAFGVKEFGYITLLGAFGVIKADALAISLVSRILLVGYSLIGGIILLLRKRDGK